MTKTVEEEIAELRAARLERERAREAKLAERAQVAELATEKILAALADAREDAEAKHGAVGREIVVVRFLYANGDLGGAAIARRPHRADWAAYQRRVSALNLATEAGNGRLAELAKELWTKHLVWPSVDEIEALEKKLPTVGDALALAITEIAGISTKEVAGKS